MPIYEFRCVECGNIQEYILTSSSEEIELKCRECQAENMERVLSHVSYAMGSSGSKGSDSSPSVTNRTCSPGQSCSTITLPGHTR